MADVMAAYGRTTHVASLWLYASNDSFWGAYWPRAWFDAFARGGSPAQFVMTERCPTRTAINCSRGAVALVRRGGRVPDGAGLLALPSRRGAMSDANVGRRATVPACRPP
jgi:hypothetical protein